jgi:hypothetical protein
MENNQHHQEAVLRPPVIDISDELLQLGVDLMLRQILLKLQQLLKVNKLTHISFYRTSLESNLEISLEITPVIASLFHQVTLHDFQTISKLNQSENSTSISYGGGIDSKNIGSLEVKVKAEQSLSDQETQLLPTMLQEFNRLCQEISLHTKTQQPFKNTQKLTSYPTLQLESIIQKLLQPLSSIGFFLCLHFNQEPFAYQIKAYFDANLNNTALQAKRRDLLYAPASNDSTSSTPLPLE